MSFQAGVGASLTTFTANTVAHAGDVNGNFTNLNNGAVSNDGGHIKTDGGGNVDFNGQLSTSGTVAFDCSGFDTFVNARGNTNTVHIRSGVNEIATFSTADGLSLQAGNVSGPSVIKVGVSLGVRNATGGKLFEMKSNGNAIIGGTQYQTSASTISTVTSQSFDSFDIAEMANSDAMYEGGTVVCPDEQGRYTRCTHEGCPHAVIVSSSAGVLLGVVDEQTEHAAIPLALAGRVQAKTTEERIAVRSFLSSAGDGTLHAMRPGESGYVLGYALTPAQEGSVGIFLRAMWYIVPSQGGR